MIQLLQGDCREVLAGMAEGSVDSCVTDPPYGDTSLTWDRKVHGWIPAVARVLKPNASFWVFGSMRFLAPLFEEMEQAGFRYGQDIVWEKQNGTGFHADRFKRVHEHAVMFYRGAWADVYRCVQYTADATARTVRRKTRPTHTGHIDAGRYTSEDGGPRMARSVIYARNEHGRAVHPTQKPIEVVQPLVLFSTPPGGVVLDPFAGSGTTLLAAERSGVSSVGIELSPGYIDIARARILAEDPDLAMLGSAA